MKRKLTQIMLILIMLFGLTAWKPSGIAPARPTGTYPRVSRHELYEMGLKHTGTPPDVRRIGESLP